MSIPSHDDVYELFLQHFDENPALRERLAAATNTIRVPTDGPTSMIHIELNGLPSMKFPWITAIDILAEDDCAPIRYSKKGDPFYEWFIIRSWAEARAVWMENFPITTVTVGEDPEAPLGYYSFFK